MDLKVSYSEYTTLQSESESSKSLQSEGDAESIPPKMDESGLKSKSGLDSVASLQERGRTAQGDTLQGVTPEGKKLWANLQRIEEKRGRTGKKSVG